ncbi:hypothetical protein LCGC14_1873250 [marine sediment metagenome]|uniref:Uncharacterized protein n=1 Tax=marine sediment metagenome TaxID=412755 RepID=A0A0F9G499_9ZZZZ
MVKSFLEHKTLYGLLLLIFFPISSTTISPSLNDLKDFDSSIGVLQDQH